MNHSDRMYKQYVRARALKAMVESVVNSLGLRAEVTIDPHHMVVITPLNDHSMKEIRDHLDELLNMGIRTHKVRASLLMPHGAITIDVRS